MSEKQKIKIEYHVFQYYSMSDFVTGRMAELIFNTKEGAEEFIKIFESKNPGRCNQWIREVIK